MERSAVACGNTVPLLVSQQTMQGSELSGWFEPDFVAGRCVPVIRVSKQDENGSRTLEVDFLYGDYFEKMKNATLIAKDFEFVY